MSCLKGYNSELVMASCMIMTAFGGGLATVTPNTPMLFVALGTMATFGVVGVFEPPATIAITVAYVYPSNFGADELKINQS